MCIVKLVAVIPIFALIAGCIPYTGGDNIKRLTDDLVASARVGSIVVLDVPADVSAEFKPALEEELRKKTSECAKGQTELSLEVNIAEVKKQNAAKTIFLGDSNGIKGQARLIRAATGEVVGDYEIFHSVGGEGAAVAVGLSGAERQMAVDFADAVCARAFRPK